jgi:hypothetical protein
MKTKTRSRKAPEVFVLVESEAQRWEDAWRSIEPAFDALRGLTKLSLNLGVWRNSAADKSPRQKIAHPLWMIVQKDSGKTEWAPFITEEIETD